MELQDMTRPEINKVRSNIQRQFATGQISYDTAILICEAIAKEINTRVSKTSKGKRTPVTAEQVLLNN